MIRSILQNGQINNKRLIVFNLSQPIQNRLSRAEIQRKVKSNAIRGNNLKLLKTVRRDMEASPEYKAMIGKEKLMNLIGSVSFGCLDMGARV
jgi:hypothetical protein